MSYLKFKKFYLVPVDEFDAAKAGKCETKSLSEDLILTNIPKKFLRDAIAILNYIKGKITWTESGALLNASGAAVAGSHISDLIRYVICPFGKNEPIALTEFRTQLDKLNLPSGLVNNPKTIGGRRAQQLKCDDWLSL